MLLNRCWTSDRNFVPFNPNMSYNSRFIMNREECNSKTSRYYHKIFIAKSTMKCFRAHNWHLILWRSTLANQSYFHVEHLLRIFSTAALDMLIRYPTKAWKEKPSLWCYFLWKGKGTSKQAEHSSENDIPVLTLMVLTWICSWRVG